MTDTAALDALIEAVEAGNAGWNRLASIAEVAIPPKEAALVATAHHGSLDAAKALHEALLPGWAWTIQENGEQTLWPPNYIADESWCADGVTVSIQDMNPARAWLIAALKAYRAQVVQ